MINMSPMEKEIEIKKLAYGGEGLGMLDGKICFVEGALPGETVAIRAIQDKGNFFRAKLAKILKSSDARREPECPYVRDCGGCQYQHVSYAAELEWKEIQVREYMERYLKISPELVRKIEGMDAPYRYRNTVTLHAQKDRIGFIGPDNRSVAAVKDCLLVDEKFSGVFSPDGFGAGKRKTFRLSSAGEVLSGDEDALFEVEIGKKKLVTGSKSFFQNNLRMTGRIAAKVAEWTAETKPEIFADLYAGVGTFSVLSAGAAGKIVCAEDNPDSMQALEANLRLLGRDFEILRGKVENVFPEYLKNQKPAKQMLFLDPPRTGMEKSFCEFLAVSCPAQSLVYLSCHLGTLTRDLGTILKKGNFKIREIVPFDMFPRTKHIEIAVYLAPVV